MPTGPSTSTAPYLLSLQPNVTFTSIATVGDVIGTKPGGGARVMVGVPDGIGAFDNGDGTATVLFNHELGATTGVAREHGSTGSFVDRMVINKTTLQVVSSQDLIKQVFLDPDGAGVYTGPTTTAFERFCSADLPAITAFYNARTNLGTTERIFMTNEETSPPFTTDYGRGFAVVVTGPDAGKAFELPRIGNISFENQVANPASGDKTIVMAMDDTGNGTTTGGQVYMYVGTKQATGNTVERAGLTNGQLYGIIVNGVLDETAATALPGGATSFTLGQLAKPEKENGVDLQTDSEAAGLTEFLRPEDGAWDPSHPNWFYFNTTASFAGPSRLWRLEFSDLNNPTAGGTIRMLLDGTEGQRMLDNMTVTADGKVVLVEDVGNNAFLGRVLIYDPVTDSIGQLGIHDAARFVTGGAGFITQDEEASGVIDVTSIFGGPTRQAFLIDTQAHNALGGEVVEGGQLEMMFIDTPQNGGPGDDTINGSYAADNLSGAGGNDTMRGGSGNDTLSGNEGNDTIDGGAGNDTMIGGPGNDTYFVDSLSDQVIENAGEGQDTAIVTVSGYTLAANVEIGTVGTTTGLRLDGHATQNSILFGNAGGDTLVGGAGNNAVNGGAGGDTIYGRAGSDWLGGGGGNDWLIGEQDNDVLVGEAGIDRFVFTYGDGKDIITDLNPTNELIDLRGYAVVGVTNFASLMAHATQVGNDVVITFDANNAVSLLNVQLNQLSQNGFLFS